MDPTGLDPFKFDGAETPSVDGIDSLFKDVNEFAEWYRDSSTQGATGATNPLSWAIHSLGSLIGSAAVALLPDNGEQAAEMLFAGQQMAEVAPLAEAAGRQIAGKISGIIHPVANTADDGVNLRLRYRDDWSDAQRAAADIKAAALSDSDTVVRVGPFQRSGTASSFRRTRGLDSSVDADHLIDLQLGGSDTIDNIWSLDRSVNRSFGSQIHQQIKDLPEGAIINNVTIE